MHIHKQNAGKPPSWELRNQIDEKLDTSFDKQNHISIHRATRFRFNAIEKVLDNRRNKGAFVFFQVQTFFLKGLF